MHEPVISGGPPSLINERCQELQQQKQQQNQPGRQRKAQAAAAVTTTTTGATTTAGAVAPLRKPCAQRARPAGPRGGSCPHLAGLSKGGKPWEAFVDDALGSPLDVEELARAGSAHGVCPYYASRRLVRHADLLLLPYASLLSHEARDALGIGLQGAVVIFDEVRGPC